MSSYIWHAIGCYGSVSKPGLRSIRYRKVHRWIILFKSIINGHNPFWKDVIAVSTQLHSSSDSQPVTDWCRCGTVVNEYGWILQVSFHFVVNDTIAFTRLHQHFYSEVTGYLAHPRSVCDYYLVAGPVASIRNNGGNHAIKRFKSFHFCIQPELNTCTLQVRKEGLHEFSRIQMAIVEVQYAARNIYLNVWFIVLDFSGCAHDRFQPKGMCLLGKMFFMISSSRIFI